MAVFWTMLPAEGADLRLNQVSPTVVEIAGGSGPQAWRLRYGTPEGQVLLAPVEGDRAYFSHGSWLRLIDTKKGLVVGRWRFPNAIVRLVPEGGRLQVHVQEEAYQQVFRRTLTFDPSAPAVPHWPEVSPWRYWLSVCEPRLSSEFPPISRGQAGCRPFLGHTSTKSARKQIPELEEMIRRDPLSPWFRIILGQLLRHLSDARAAAVFQEALEVPITDFTEWLPISSFLESLGERAAAGAAFERAYRDFFERGNDPRFFVVLIGPLILHPPPGRWEDLTPEHRRELVERIYRLTPGSEGAEYAWPVYADYLEKNGPAEEARVWRARAQEKASVLLFSGLLAPLDRATLVFAAAVLASLFYILVLYVRYRPQRRLDLAARERTLGRPPLPEFLYMRTWSRGERAVFFALILAVWLMAFWQIPPPPRGVAVFYVVLAISSAFHVALLFVIVLYLLHRQRLGVGEDQEFSVLHMGQWSRGERIGFFVVLCGAWIWGFLGASPRAAPFPLAVQATWASIAGALLYLLILYVRYWPRRRARTGAGLAPSFPWFNVEYWDRRERVAFFTILLVGWVAWGVVGGLTRGFLRIAEMPLSVGMGSFAGPGTVWHFENLLPATPERDLLLALAYQQSGESDRAERLYRRLPNFAESWNNLGVLLKNAGKHQEAREAFEQALRLNPGLAEAAWNLGRPPQSFWAELHLKYLPGRPMLAPPGLGRVQRAYLGGSLAKICLQGLAGPFVGKLPGWLTPLSGEARTFLFLALFLSLIPLAAAVAMLLRPSREVTQPPGRAQAVLETLFPGASPAWRVWGGLALAAWCYFLVQDLLLLLLGTPYIITFIALPNIVRSYGVLGDFSSLRLRTVGGLLNPNWFWVYVAPALLFAVNLVLLWRARRRAASSSLG